MYYPLHSSYTFPNGIKEKYMFVHKELITITVVPSRLYRTHTPEVQNYAAKPRPSTALYTLMMDHIKSETCLSDF